MPQATGAITRATIGAAGISAAAAAVFFAGAAMSGVDGVRGVGEYGVGPVVQAGYNPSAPDSSVRTPASGSSYAAYDSYLRSDPGFYYGLFQARPGPGETSAGTFGSIYVDLDPANGNGSDLGIEIGNAATAFVPGAPGGVVLPDVAITRSGDGLTLEFAIPTSRIAGPIAGLAYYPGQVFPGAGSPDAVFSPSPSFSLPAARGAPLGIEQPDRIALVATDVPEPATSALFLVGLAGAGALRRRRMPA